MELGDRTLSFGTTRSSCSRNFGGNANGGTNEVPDAAESKTFWEGIWSVEVEHNDKASGLGGSK